MHLKPTKKNIFVIYKPSRLEMAQKIGAVQDSKSQAFISLQKAHNENYKTLDHIKIILNNLGITYNLICRDDLTPGNYFDNLVISVGGDGTVLECSHHCTDNPIIGVNSDPSSSVGALCTTDRFGLEKLLVSIFANQIQPKALSRLKLQSEQHQKNIPLILNDVLFCHKNPACMSRFCLNINQHQEEHRSSGIWIATAAGSTGGILSAGAGPLELNSSEIIFKIREPYWTSNFTPILCQGKFGTNKKLIITSFMTEQRLFLDGPHKFLDLELGEKIIIKNANEPLFLYVTPRLLTQRKILVSRKINLSNLKNYETN